MNATDQTDPKSFLTQKMETKPFESKKFLSAAIGLMCVMLVWLGTIICMFIKTDIASHFVSLATIVISFVGAITTTILTGQAVFDYKAMATIQTVDTNDKQENVAKTNNGNKSKNNNTKHLIIDDDGCKPKPFAQAATHPEGVDK